MDPLTIALALGAAYIFMGGTAKNGYGDLPPPDDELPGGETPVAGGTTGKPDGAIHKYPDQSFVFACNGRWWVGGLGKICCKGASGTAVTIGDGTQIVCAFDDGTASYRWKAVPGA